MMDNNKPDIKGITSRLQTEILEVWNRIECKSFRVDIQYKPDGNVNLIPLRDEIIKSFKVDNHEDVAGIYMIYVFDNATDGLTNDLFYIGESRSSIFRRLRRHFNKVEKQKNGSSPDRYKPFSKLLEKDKNVQIKILKFNNGYDDLRYRRIIEEILTLSENPTYIDSLNENLFKRKSVEQGEI